jgi:hypothetical protein
VCTTAGSSSGWGLSASTAVPFGRKPELLRWRSTQPCACSDPSSVVIKLIRGRLVEAASGQKDSEQHSGWRQEPRPASAQRAPAVPERLGYGLSF